MLTGMSSRLMGRRSVALWVCAHVALLLGVSWWWLGRNELPDGYQNEFIHLFTLGEIFFRIRDDGLVDALPFITDQYWPPLLHLLPSMALMIFEPSRELVTLVGSLAVIPVLAATAALAMRLGGPLAAYLATSLTAFAPMIFGNARRYEPNLLLAAFLTCTAWFLTTRADRSQRAFALGAGVLIGGGLLADRLVFAVYLAPVVVLLAVRERGLRRWLGVGLVTALVSGWYYVRFFTLHLGEITSQLGGEVSVSGEQNAIGVLSLKGLLYYPLSWLDGGTGLLPGLVLIAGLVAWIRTRRPEDAPSSSVLEPLLVGALVLFTLVGKKQPYYALPLLPVAAVLASVGLVRLLPSARWRNVLVVGVALLGLNQLAFLSFDRALLPTPGRWAVLAGDSPFPQGFLGNEYVQAAPPAPSGVQPARIAALCREQGDATVLFSEGQGAYEGQLMPTLRLALDTRRVPGLVMEPEAWTESADAASCLVYVAPAIEGPDGPAAAPRTWPTEASLRAILQQWNQAEPSAELLAAFTRARARADLVARWRTERSETVYVYALGTSRSPDLP